MYLPYVEVSSIQNKILSTQRTEDRPKCLKKPDSSDWEKGAKQQEQQLEDGESSFLQLFIDVISG